MIEGAAGGKSGMGRNAIEIRGLVKTYAGGRHGPEKRALKGVDLEIPQGSVFGLLGPNGAGKSTLINILAGLVIKTAGQVTIWGFDQDSDEILRLVGLEDQAGAYARTLSGGMRRRLLLAKALVHHPHILVLDEPTAGVDIELRQMLWENVRRLNREGMTIILTTHYLEEAEEMCDEIAIINQGEVVARDSTARLLGRLDGKTMIIQPEAPAASLPEGPGLEVTRRADGAIVIAYRASETPAEAVLAAVRAAGISIRDVRTEQADLQDVFLDLTRRRVG
jgi:ABC-2 type transport system ATP-binding protein